MFSKNSNILLPAFLLLHLVQPLSAQKVITGFVYDDTGNPIEGVTVVARDFRQEKVFAYDMSSTSGSFELKVPEKEDSLSVMVSSFNIQSETRMIYSGEKDLIFRVALKALEIKEAIIKAPKIKEKGDTLEYYVSSFIDENDRVIGDVLKRLPGIQVLPSGKILYNNMEILNFYVEDMDLLQGRYGLATNNISADKIASVQVYENHQPIKVLKDQEYPESAAINLKLKQSVRGVFLANCQLGVGLPLGLLSNEAIGMRFSARHQGLVLYKGDNTGRDINAELTSFYGMSSNRPLDLFSGESVNSPQIGEQYYLHNNAHLISVNELLKTRKGSTVAVNADYLKDVRTSCIELNKVIYAGSEGVVISEIQERVEHDNSLSGTLNFEKNTDDVYLKNRTDISVLWNGWEDAIDGISAIEQKYSLPSISFGNDFQLLKKHGSHTNRINSRLSVSEANQSLSVSRGDGMIMDKFSSRITQFIDLREINGSISYRGYDEITDNLNLFYEAGLEVENASLISEILETDTQVKYTIDSLRNDVVGNSVEIRADAGVIYRKKRMTISAQVPLSGLFLENHNHISGTQDDRMLCLFKPKLSMDFSLSRFSVNFNIYHISDYRTFRDDIGSYILTSYRNLQKFGEERDITRYNGLDFYIGYRNPISTLFISLLTDYSLIHNNLLSSIDYDGIWGTYEKSSSPNNISRFHSSFSVEKSIDPVRTDVKFSSSWQSTYTPVAFQEIRTESVRNNFSLNGYATSEISRNVRLSYSAKYNAVSGSVLKQKMQDVKDFSQSLILDVSLSSKLSVNFSINHYLNRNASPKSHFFSNLGIRYKMRKVDVRLDWTNIFNVRSFVWQYNDMISSYRNTYELRPSELLLRLRFSIE